MPAFRELHEITSFKPVQVDDDPMFVRAVARAVTILSVFELTTKPLSLTEIANLSGIDRSAVQRIVHTLQVLGMISRDNDDRGYVPGKRVLTMAYSSMRLHPVVQMAAPILLELRRRSQERVDMSLWDDTHLIYTLRMPSKHDVFTATLSGNIVPVYCTAGGLAVMSRLGDEEISDIFARSDTTPFTPETFTTLDQVREAVEATRQRGFALTVGQLLRNEVALGVAITDARQRPLGALHLAGTINEYHPDDFAARFGPLLQDAGRSLSSPI